MAIRVYCVKEGVPYFATYLLQESGSLALLCGLQGKVADSLLLPDLVDLAVLASPNLLVYAAPMVYHFSKSSDLCLSSTGDGISKHTKSEYICDLACIASCDDDLFFV